MESGVRLQTNELATRTLGLQASLTSLTIIGGIYEKYGHRTPALLYAPGQGLRLPVLSTTKGILHRSPFIYCNSWRMDQDSDFPGAPEQEAQI